ncbi:hypothetical protein [Kitasatospora sp. NPDC050543]|uniref:hypothetical protein n=1 Tax=Kitasatospora sp. NPDC050543 TaxID=3364054 RepID=UPI00378BB265
MPVFPEEPEIHESIPGPGVPFPRESDAQALRTPAAGSASPVVTPKAVPAVPGPRPAPPRPAPPQARRPVPSPRPAPAPKPGPGPRRQAPAVRYVAAGVRDALERADEAVDLLLESGRPPGEVLVLTVGAPHPWQQHELSFGEERYWAQLAEGGDVFYADAAAALARSARREVVVLVVNDGAGTRAADAYRGALGRAGELLVVCGEADLVGAPGGPGSRAVLA